MDIEKENRLGLKEALSSDFDCYEECRFLHPHFADQEIRADLVALGEFRGIEMTFAFDVTVPTAKWELKNWLSMIKQAADYSGAKIQDHNVNDGSIPKKIDCSFIYPSPDLSRDLPQNRNQSRFYREGDKEPIRGALLLAQHFKVGQASQDATRKKRIRLRLGADTVWQQGEGLRPKAELILLHRIGTRHIKRKFSNEQYPSGRSPDSA